MARVTFGNVSVDMRAGMDYGIPGVQNWFDFMTGFIPVGQPQILVNTPTTIKAAAWDAANHQVTVTFTGNIPQLHIDSIQVEGGGMVAKVGGNFNINPNTLVLSGWVTSDSLRYSAGNALIASISGINLHVSTDTPWLMNGSDASLLAGNDTITGGNGNDHLLGYAGNDSMSGGGGNDTLNGGTGADSMAGGKGNDTYLVDRSGDHVTEYAGGGSDTVKAAVTYTLPANVEHLTLTGMASIDGTGNLLANQITGNAGSNALRGDAGNDSLSGNAGNDRLDGGAGADNLAGNAGNDLLRGGAGRDALTGGAGQDTFRFDTAPNAASNLDRITDFSAADDFIQLENAVFAKLTTTGALAAANFRAGPTAADANDYIVYNAATGALYYDADGDGAGAAVQIAQLGTHPAITAADFVVA